MDDRLRVLLMAMREAALIVVAAIEDYVSVPYDRSSLAKRRQKVEHG